MYLQGMACDWQDVDIVRITQDAVRTIGYVITHLERRYGILLQRDESGAYFLADGSSTCALDLALERLYALNELYLHPPNQYLGSKTGMLDCGADLIERDLIEAIGFCSAQRSLPRTFRIWLSHDIDQLRISYQLLTWTAQALRTGRIGDANSLILNWIRAKLESRDLFWNLDEVLEIEANYKIHATYFFLDQPRIGKIPSMRNFSLYFGLYSLLDERVSDLVRYVQATGAEIGIHGSVGTSLDFDRYVDEIDNFQRIGLDRPRIGRQHWLDFQCWKTTEIFESAGIQLDSSIGFNAPGWGFRMGTAHPLYLPLDRATASSVLHITPCLQDGSLWDNWRDQIDLLLHNALTNHATLGIVWHNSAFCRRPMVKAAYTWLIEKALELGGEIVLGREILSLNETRSLPVRVE